PPRGRAPAGPLRRHRPDRGLDRRRPPRRAGAVLPPARTPPEEALTVPTPLLCLALLLAAPPAESALRTDGKARLLVAGGKVVKGGVEMPYANLLKLTVVVEGGKALEV